MNEKSTVTLLNKNNLGITGVNKIISLDDKHFTIDTQVGIVKITGYNLEMEGLDSNNKIINIKGEIDQISYKTTKEKTETFIKKIFK